MKNMLQLLYLTDNWSKLKDLSEMHLSLNYNLIRDRIMKMS